MKIGSIFLSLLLAAGCAPLKDNQSMPPATSPVSADAEARFARLSDDFTAGYLDWRPGTGTELGLHQYDGRTTDLSRASISNELARLQRFDRELAAFPAGRLSKQTRLDYRLLRTAIAGELFAFQDMQSYTRNPMTYAAPFDVNIYIKRNFAPLTNRVHSIIAIERAVPDIMAAARANLDDSLPQPYVETAIDEANGAADFLGKELVDALKNAPDQTQMAEFNRVNRTAIASLRDYASWLKQEKLPKANNNFALGREKYQRMLRDGELIPLPPEEILAIGLQELHRVQGVFADAAHTIDPNRKPIDVFKEIQAEHPTAENLIPDTRKDLGSIYQFLIDHQIITLPTTNRVFVEATPEYARATTFASMDSPGPFETKATEAYYYVTPVENDWTPKQKEEWLTAFNYYTMDVVSIHEAYPGHFVQFQCEQASAATRLEKIFGSYAFVEGWAHYCEQMMLDEGFGAGPAHGATAADRVRAAKYRLAQSDEALLRICRLCVSVKMHCEGMSLDDATRFFEENCYYEPKPARQEAIRGTFDPGYLYYTLGKLEFLKLRADYQKQEGASYSLWQFHDEALRHGTPPVRLLREVMLKDPKEWDDLF
jgi:uncharacterized protein (DUF885 family)